MKLELDELKPEEKSEQLLGMRESAVWYAIAVISITFILIGILLANPFIDYQTASTL